MRLFAILSWFDESPTWLAATTASLQKIGVDHLIAVDGSYQTFEGPASSGVEQAEAIQTVASACGMGTTIVRPESKLWSEVDKRTVCFKILNVLATPMLDWVMVIDADEVISRGSMEWKLALYDMPESTHAAAANLEQSVDPSADPKTGVPNVTQKTEEIYRRLDLETKFQSRQTRFWRVLNDMRVVRQHFAFYGTDDDGQVWRLRPDIGKPVVADAFDAVVVDRHDRMPTIEHRDPWRTMNRQLAKKRYYQERDESRLEA